MKIRDIILENTDDEFAPASATKEKTQREIERYQLSLTKYAVVAPDSEVLEYFITIDEAIQYAISQVEDYLDADYKPTDKIKIHNVEWQSRTNDMGIGPVHTTIALNGTIKTKSRIA